MTKKIETSESNVSRVERVQRCVMWACVVLAMACVIAGRVETFHMTEGEAFIYGWKYWTATIGFAFGAGLVIKRHT